MFFKSVRALAGVASRYVTAMASGSQFRPVVMSGPSGSGKSTLVKKLMQEHIDCFAFSVSHTTRPPRDGEVNGKDYYFVSKEDMEKAIANEEFIEYATFSNNMYGTSKKAVEDVVKTGRICILDIDMQGVKSVKKTDLNCRYIFVKPPNERVLEERLRARGTESEENLQRRLSHCKEEIAYAAQKGTYDHIVVNDDLEVAYEKLKGILIKEIDEYIKNKHRAH